MKHTLLALLGLILLTMPLTATAQQYGDFTYTSDGSAITITGYTGPGGDVTIPDSINGLPVTAIGSRAFYSKYSLTKVSIPAGVITIGDSAFEGCPNLTDVTIPASVTTIGAIAFESCLSLTSVTIPASVTSIGILAFGSCTGLTSITIPASVTNIGDYLFRDCPSLTAITVDPANSFYSSANGVLFDKNQSTLIEFPGGQAGSYTIPAGVTSIGSEAFWGCSNLTSVSIGNGVTNMGNYSFYECTKLTSVTIPASVTSIGNDAFFKCTSLTSVTLPAGVTIIGGNAFAFCTSLTNITLPANLIGFGNWAFSDCYSLTSVTIPASVVLHLGNFTFAYCYSLKAVYFLGNAPSGTGTAFYGATNATVYYLPGTTGWGATFGGRPAVLWNPLMQTSGVGPAGFGFNISGTADIPIVIEAATNFANPAWVPLQSLNLTNGAFYFSDPTWTNYPARFYRIRSP